MHAESIAYILMLFRDAYPREFYYAYPKEEARVRARGIWKEALKDFSPKRIKNAGHFLIKNSLRLPSLGEVVHQCKAFTGKNANLKHALQAYYEACNMQNPSINSPWSHIIVYYAGKNTGWYLLKTSTQDQTYPLFKHNYEIARNRFLNGEDLTENITKAIECDPKYKTNLEGKQQQMMQNLNIDPHAGRRAFEDILKELG